MSEPTAAETTCPLFASLSFRIFSAAAAAKDIANKLHAIAVYRLRVCKRSLAMNAQDQCWHPTQKHGQMAPTLRREHELHALTHPTGTAAEHSS